MRDPLKLSAPTKEQGTLPEEVMAEGRVATDAEHKKASDTLFARPDVVNMSRSLKKRDQDAEYDDKKKKEFKDRLKGVAEANGGHAGSAKVRYTSGMHGTYEPTKQQSSPQAHLDAAKYHDNEANTYITAMNSPKALPKNTEWYKREIHHHKNKADFHRQSSAQQGVAEGLEQIDEISAQTKASYVTKAKAEVKEMQPHAKKSGEYRSFAKSIIAKRKAGIAMANEEVAGWIAHYNGQKHEIKKHEAKDLWDAKQKAIAHFKAPKSKHGLIAIKPAYNEEVEQIDEVASHAELAALAHKAYIAATSQGLVHLANHYLERHKKHKALASKENKKGMSEEVEQIEEGRPSQQHPIEGHEYHKKSDAELRYIMKDAGTAAKAMKDHSPRAESKYLDQVNDASTVLSFRQRNGTPAWYKKKYDHVNESVDTPPFTPDAPKKNSGVVVGKRPEGMSKARHLARLAMKGELNKKKTVKEDSSNDVEKTNTPAKRTVSKTTMIVKDAAKSSKDKNTKDKFEPEPELSSQLVRNNF